MQTAALYVMRARQTECRRRPAAAERGAAAARGGGGVSDSGPHARTRPESKALRRAVRRNMGYMRCRGERTGRTRVQGAAVARRAVVRYMHHTGKLMQRTSRKPAGPGGAAARQWLLLLFRTLLRRRQEEPSRRRELMTSRSVGAQGKSVRSRSCARSPARIVRLNCVHVRAASQLRRKRRGAGRRGVGAR